MKKLLLTLALIPCLVSANTIHGTDTEKRISKNIPCSINVNNKLSNEIKACFTKYRISKYRYFVWPNGRLTYTAERDGKMYKGKIDKTLTNWVSL